MVDLLGVLLLVLALVVPVVGAVLLRVLHRRISEKQVVISASLFFALAIVSVLVLARLPISSLQIGSFTLLLPISSKAIGYQAQPMRLEFISRQGTITETDAMLMHHHEVLDTQDMTDTLVLTLTTTLRMTPTTTLAITPTPTIVVTPTATAMLTPTNTPTPLPPPTDTPLPEPAQPRIHVVKEGELLGFIAETYGVSVRDLMRANGMSEADANRLQIGQELIIP